MKLLIQHGNLIDPVLNEERVMDILIECLRYGCLRGTY